jgi:hypothetical protein
METALEAALLTWIATTSRFDEIMTPRFANRNAKPS